MSKAKLGMLLFLFSESIFFVFLLVAYINFHSGPGKLSMSHNLNVGRTTVFTVFLILSSFTLWQAHHQAIKKRITQFHYWLGATIILGIAFLWGQLTEYFNLFHQEVTISRDPLSTGFFTVTGFHGLHVILGVFLLMMLLIWSMIQKHRNKALPSGSLESIFLYWHFVDMVWVAVFAIVYVWGTQ